ncbi:glycosyltransferase family 4 protein [Hyphomicrobium sp. 2TAF46]
MQLIRMPLSGDGQDNKTRRLLLEGYNLALSAGTGIATYSRTLGSAARALGYQTDLLVSTNRAIDESDAVMAEITVFDGPRNLNLIHKGQMELRRLFGAPLGVKAGVLKSIDGVVARPNASFDGFRRIYGVPFLLDVERLHFMRHGTRLRLRVDQPPDVFHVTRAAPIHISGAANINTIHDIIPLRLPSATADDKKYYLGMLREIVRTADHIVTVSEFSRQDIIQLTGISPDRITNTYQPVILPKDVTEQSDAAVSDMLAAKYGLDFKDYFLFVGAIEPKKNIARLVDAYAASGVQRPLIIAGGLGWMYEKELEKIADERFLSYTVAGKHIVPKRRVRRLSYVPYGDLVSVMRGARALLFPSLYEGFGLPVLEAMTVGTPTMSSNVTSLPEIAGDAGCLVDPFDVDAMAQAIQRLDVDRDYREELAARGLKRASDFSLEKYQRRLRSVYDKVTG